MLNKALIILFLFLSVRAFCWDPATKIAVLGIDSRIKGEEIETSGFSEMIQSEFVRQKAYIIVERAQLSKILEEQKLQSSGIAENDAARVGSIAGAGKIIMGSLFKIEDEYQLLIKVIDISTGTIEIYEEIKGRGIAEISGKIPEAVKDIIQKSKGEKIEEQTVQTNIPEEKYTRTEGFFPVQLSFVRRIQLIPENFMITGVAVVLITGYNSKIIGVQAGLISECGMIIGTQDGLICTANDKMLGMQAGIINNIKGDLIGAQFGLINTAGNVIGAQVGFMNTARTLHGVQIGLLNFVKQGWAGFMPIINIGF